MGCKIKWFQTRPFSHKTTPQNAQNCARAPEQLCTICLEFLGMSPNKQIRQFTNSTCKGPPLIKNTPHPCLGNGVVTIDIHIALCIRLISTGFCQVSLMKETIIDLGAFLQVFSKRNVSWLLPQTSHGKSSKTSSVNRCGCLARILRIVMFSVLLEVRKNQERAIPGGKLFPCQTAPFSNCP